MFEHSVKVPRHYKIAANIFKKVSTEGGSVKSLLYDNKLRHFRTDVLFAIITETIKHVAEIEKIFESCKLLEHEPRLDPWLAKILTTELLYGKKELPGKSKPEQTILSYKDKFESYKSQHQDDSKPEEQLTMAEADEGPLIPKQTKMAVIVLANLFVYSIAMFTLPFIAFFGVRHILTEYYPVNTFSVTVWSVLASVVVVNIIICAYAYKAYHETEYDEHGNEIDQHAYTPAVNTPAEGEKSNLNLKQD